jgi:alkyl sulfatase BDS1-like metallo-beta-lactamase superfamily hydrolase
MESISDFFGLGITTTFADGLCHLIGSFANCCIIETDDGLILFDIGQERFGSIIFNQLREITNKPIKYIIFSHGHFDHCFGFKPFLDEINAKGWPKPQIIAHKNCITRFEKYRELRKYHQWINRKQFSSVIGDEYQGPSALNTLDPTFTMRDNEYSFQLGGFTFHLYHEYGETDDSLWLWFPEKEVIFSGDLIVSSFPNVGNPYKVQRYPKQWAYAMEKMIEKNAKFLAPGHGKLIEGKERVKDVLSITAEAMHFVHDEVVKRMNEGKWFEQIYHEMLKIYPDKFKNHLYLSPVYGCYPFAIHAVYRLYHGWYDSGNPTNLFPARSDDIARELLKISGADAFIERGRQLAEKGELQLALHIIDPIIKGFNIKDKEISETFYAALMLKKIILEKLIETESSFIASNIMRNGINQLNKEIDNFKDLRMTNQ